MCFSCWLDLPSGLGSVYEININSNERGWQNVPGPGSSKRSVCKKIGRIFTSPQAPPKIKDPIRQVLSKPFQIIHEFVVSSRHHACKKKYPIGEIISSILQIIRCNRFIYIYISETEAFYINFAYFSHRFNP